MSARRLTRIAGTTLLVAGIAVLAWVIVVWRWQDPFTALYTHWKQHQLAQSYEKRFAAYRPVKLERNQVSVATSRKTIEREARGTASTPSGDRRSAASSSRDSD